MKQGEDMTLGIGEDRFIIPTMNEADISTAWWLTGWTGLSRHTQGQYRGRFCSTLPLPKSELSQPVAKTLIDFKE
jgi:hypothetical protein